MLRKTLPRPTDTELAILRVLWRSGPATVRSVHDELCQIQETGYTTVLKMMQVMTEKGLLKRDASQRSHIYEATLAEEATQRQLVGYLLEKAFNGSAQKLVMQALSAKQATPEELAAIRRMLDQMEGKAK